MIHSILLAGGKNTDKSSSASSDDDTKFPVIPLFHHPLLSSSHVLLSYIFFIFISYYGVSLPK
jgi:hypothetical protein